MLRRLFLILFFLAAPAQATDFAFRFTEHVDFVDDASFTAADQAFIYPHTYTTRDGTTMIAGWESLNANNCQGGMSPRTRNLTGDPRLAGMAFTPGNNVANQFQCIFRIDLPATGNWAISFAASDTVFGPINEYVTFEDNGVSFASCSNVNVDTSHFMDANCTVIATALWPLNNVPLQHTFTSTKLEVLIGPNSASSSLVSVMGHLRITSGTFPTTPRITPAYTLNGMTVVTGGQTIQFASKDAGTWACSGTNGSGGAVACAGSINSGTGLYTAPATITAQHADYGLQILPNNHVYNVRVDSLPVDSNAKSTVSITSSPTGAVRSGNVVTITTTTAPPLPGYQIGQPATIAGVTDNSFNGTFPISSIPGGCSSLCFTYSQSGANATSGSGSVSIPWMSLLTTGSLSGNSLAYDVGFPVNYVNCVAGNCVSVDPTIAVAVTTPHQFFYYTNYLNNEPMNLPQFPDAQIESGWLNAQNFGGPDHHLITVSSSNGAIDEFYQFYAAGLNGSCSSCTSQGATHYKNSWYTFQNTQFGSSTTDAAGMQLIPLTSSYQEVRQAVRTGGTLNHALRFTVGLGFECSCVRWPGTVFASDGAFLPFGARVRLKSTFPISSLSSLAQLFLTQVKQYGIINADGGNMWDIGLMSGRYPVSYSNAVSEAGGATSNFTITNTSLSSGVVTITANNDFTSGFIVDISGTTNGSGALNGSNFVVTTASGTQFTYNLSHADIVSSVDSGTVLSHIVNYLEVVNESSLQMPATQNGAIGLNPGTTGMTVANREIVTFTRTSDSATNSVDIILTGVAIGLPVETLNIQAGTPAQQLTAIVSGGTNNTVTWSMSPTVGTLTSGGLFTPPASIGALTATTFTATSTDNASVQAAMDVTVYPTGSIRIVPGRTSDYTDSNSHLWSANAAGSTSGTVANGCCPGPDGSFPNITDKALWDTVNYKFNDSFYTFRVPTGTYNLTYRVNSFYPLAGQNMEIDSQGITLLNTFDPTFVNGGQHLPYTQTFSNIVVGSNNKLQFLIRVANANTGSTGGTVDLSSLQIDSVQMGLPNGVAIGRLP
jgi:hypothetical protein